MTYVLRGGAEGAGRLEVLAAAAWPATRRLLDRLGVGPGWSCLDVGCGNGDVAIRLATLVGPAGRVVGEDIDAAVVEVARERAREAGAGVEFHARGLLGRPPEAAFDLVHARFVLGHLADAAAGLAALVRAARPGGLVVVEDVDFHSHFCWPPSEAFDRYGALYRDTSLGLGADPLIGPRLLGMFHDAGLDEPGFETVERLFSAGPGKRMPQLTMEHIREAVVGAGAATDAEVDAIVTELERLRRDPRSIMGFPRVFQVWGRRPATAGSPPR